MYRFEQHPYHIVNQSPWPYQVAFSVFQMLLGLTLYMHFFEKGLTIFFLSLICTIAGAAFWWRDVVREGTFEGNHTNVVQHESRFGMALFIVSEIMLFFILLFVLYLLYYCFSNFGSNFLPLSLYKCI